MLVRKNPDSSIIELDNLFKALPNELLLHIISLVPHSSLPSLRLTDRTFNALCKDYLFRNNQPVNLRWRLRFFQGQKKDLNADIEIEEEESGNNNCRTISSLIGLGLILATVGTWYGGPLLGNASPGGAIFFTIWMLVSLALIVWGIVQAVQAHRSSEKIGSMDQQLIDIEEGIAENRARLHNPALCLTHSHHI